MIAARCPACGRDWQFADVLAGLTVVCKNCCQRIPVPASRMEIAEPAIVPPAVSEPAAPAPASPAVAPPPESAATVDLAAGTSIVPAWALDRARASLDSGLSVPQTEQRLVGQGLSAAAATAVVDRVLFERTSHQPRRMQQDAQATRIHRLLSAVVAVAYIFLTYWFFGDWSACKALRNALLPVACIWFPDALGVYSNRFFPTTSFLGRMLRWAGWAVLLLLTARIVWLGILFGNS